MKEKKWINCNQRIGRLRIEDLEIGKFEIWNQGQYWLCVFLYPYVWEFQGHIFTFDFKMWSRKFDPLTLLKQVSLVIQGRFNSSSIWGRRWGGSCCSGFSSSIFCSSGRGYSAGCRASANGLYWLISMFCPDSSLKCSPFSFPISWSAFLTGLLSCSRSATRLIKRDEPRF